MKKPGFWRRQLRFMQIGYVLATHGMAALAVRLKLFRPYAFLVYLFQRERMPRELGGQIRLALERLGPTFIKFGQMLSTRVDLLPEEIASELKKLQDAVPPAPFPEVRALLERAFGKPLTGEGGVFAAFEEAPVAAASIAQVHFARLPDGREVAVKVRRPRVERVIAEDLAILRMLAEMFHRHFPEYRRLRAPAVVEEFARTITEELNLRAEGAHAARLAEAFADSPDVVIPRVVWDYTKREVLTTERITGIPIDEVAALTQAGHDRLALAEKLATIFFEMVFVHGYFHADMHPGNIFVTDTGAIAFVDFGIVGRLPMKTRRYLAEMLIAFLERDYRKAARVHLDAGYVPPKTDLLAFEDALREIAEPIFNRPLGEISIAELLGCMFAVTERFQMETQPQLLLLQKTMLTIEGIARELAPEANIWMLARPLISEWIARHLGPRGRAEALWEEWQAQMRRWARLPEAVEEALAARPAVVERRIVQRRAGGLAAAALAATGGFFIAQPPPEPYAPVGWVALGLALVFALRR